MSECIHLHDEEERDIGYICRGGPYVYQPCVHRPGARNYDFVGGRVDTLAEAFDTLRDELLADRARPWRQYNRGVILAVEKEMSYYEPHVVYEVLVR